jgi:hypothetical protein
MPRAEDGVALVIVLLVMVTVTALATSLALLTSTESRVTAAYRDGMEVLYGAEAALERVLPDLAAAPDFDRVLTGAVISSFTDGPPGLRRLPDATFTDLHALTAMLNCGRVACDDAALDALREDRPWGPNNPRWQLYGYGSPAGDWRVYAVVWVADDQSETDGDPHVDGGENEGRNPGRGRLNLTAHGYGPTGTRRVIEATIARNAGELLVLSWREVR